MLKLTDLFDMALFSEMRYAGFVSVQRHPEDFDLCIANYTKKAQQHYHWNEVTLQCRGLIYRESTLEVVARPPKKFFNHEESHAPKIALDEHVTAYDKVDGSLGIIYPLHGEWRIATRGSFTSDQAIKGQQLLDDMLFPQFDRAQTTVVEIVYPENRIVVNYGEWEGLVYLGDVEIETGDFLFQPHYWVGEHVEPLYQGTFRGLLELPVREGMEGFVVHDTHGNMVKVKYEEYIRLHRIVWNLSEKTVWETMNGPRLEPVRELVKDLDEEHAVWVYDVANRLLGDYMSLAIYVQEVCQRVDAKNPKKARKEIALDIRNEPKFVQSAIFRGLDNKSYIDVLWKQVQPKENKEREVTDE